jgi:hypothetical protein
LAHATAIALAREDEVKLERDFRSRFLDSQLYSSRRHLRIYSNFPRKGDDMGCLGVHFALSELEVSTLKGLPSDAARLEFLQGEIEERCFGDENELMCETDKAWDAIHRALTDGKLGYNNGQYPLNHAILGGEPLYFEGDYIMSLKMPEQVKAVAASLEGIFEHELRARYFRIDAVEYGCPVNEEDFNYTWYWFQRLHEFYGRAAAESRFVLFTADQ